MQDTGITDTIYGPDVLRQYVKAVMEGRWATVDYLRPFLPDVDLDGYMTATGPRRDVAVAGTIGGAR